MHISEGILDTPTLAGGAATAAIFISIGLKKLDYQHIMQVSLLTSTFFIASLIHIPFGLGDIHLVLNGLLGILLGWTCFPAIFAALLLQAVFFNFGGITTLGVNTLVMAIPAILAFYLVRPWLSTKGKKRMIAAYCGGFISILISSFLMALALVSTNKGFLTTAQIIVVAHLPLMIIEGFVTMFTITFLAKVHPEFLHMGTR